MAVDRLRTATDDLARSSKAMDEKTKMLVLIAGLTLAVAIVSEKRPQNIPKRP